MPFLDHYRKQTVTELELVGAWLSSVKAAIPLDSGEEVIVNHLMAKVAESMAAKKGLRVAGVDPNNYLI